MKKFQYLTLLMVSLLMLGSCGLNQRSLSFENLEIDYTRAVTRVEAAKLGAYLLENGFGKTPIRIQVDKNGLEYEIKWGVDRSFSLTDPKIKDLQKLEGTLQKEVFENHAVVLCLSEKDFTACRPVNKPLGKEFSQNNHSLFYKYPVRKKQARSIDNILTEMGFYEKGNRLAQLERHGDAYYCRLEISDWQRETEATMEWGERLRQRIEDSLYNYSLVTVELCNRWLKTEKKIEANPYKNVMSFHLDKVKYSNQLLARDIRKLGNYLQRRALFLNQGKVVKVKQNGDTYQVTFRAKYGVDDKSAINDAQLLSADLSKHVFRGSPVYVHIFDHSKKQKVIHSTMVY